MGSGSLQRMAAKKEKKCNLTPFKIQLVQTLVHTFTCNIGAKPLSRVVVEKAFGMGEADCEVSGIAGVLEDRLEGEGDSVG